jgi:hypothetical protein
MKTMNKQTWFILVKSLLQSTREVNGVAVKQFYGVRVDDPVKQNPVSAYQGGDYLCVFSRVWGRPTFFEEEEEEEEERQEETERQKETERQGKKKGMTAKEK